MDYYFAVGNEQRGPVSLQDLASYGVRPDTLVWRQGLPQWVRADSLQELAALLPQAQPASIQVQPAPVQPAPTPPPAIGPAQSVGYEQPDLRPPPSGLAIASLILGIVATPLMCAYFLGVPCAILAIVFGFIARAKVRNGQASGGGMALSGIILGFVSLALLAVLIGLVAVGIAMNP